MDEDERFVRLNVDDDYEGGQWIGGEFFYRSKRQKTAQTKDQKILGVFAGEDSSDEDRKGGRSSRKKEKMNYSKPVNFVSTGKIEPGEDLEPHTIPQESNDGPSVAKPMGPMLPEDSEAGDVELEADVLPTALGRRIRTAVAKREQDEKSRLDADRAWKDAEKSGFATFERHTKGIGAKLLAKMGYKPGQGLGRDGGGITKPVEQKMRPRGMGMGYGDFREHSSHPVADNDRSAEDTKATAVPLQQPKEKFWKKRHGVQRKKRVYQTAEDLLVQEEAAPSVTTQPIIDMRGPQARVLTNLEHLNVEETDVGTGSSVPMPELQHNMKLLVDMTEAEIRRLDTNLRQKEDTAVMLGREEKRLESELDKYTQDEARLMQLAEGLQRLSDLNPVTDLLSMETGYRDLRTKLEEEYKLYNVASVALCQVLVPFQKYFLQWDVLNDPTFGFSEVLRWRDLLQCGTAQGDAIFEDATPDAFSIFVSSVMVPPIRTAVTNSWEPRNPEHLIRLVEFWEHLWPHQVLNHVIMGLVFPKLRALVEVWEPRNEVIAIHVWLHPWLPYLGDLMKDLYPTIIFRLSTALQSWHASDGSAFALLSPWYRVFDDSLWEGLIMRSIVPKLALALQELVINPMSQDLKPFEWVMHWKDVIPVKHIASILETQFFPSWLQVLHQWLSSNPNYEEVTHWYLGWKELIPEAIRYDPQVAAQLGVALSLMNFSVEGNDLPPVGVLPKGPQPPIEPAVPSAPLHKPPSENYTLRELVQHFAQENNVEFLPKSGRMHDGLQVYGFGNVACVLENLQNVIKAQIHHQWVIVPLSRLLEEHRSRVMES